MPGAGILALPLGPGAHSVTVGLPLLPPAAVGPTVVKVEPAVIQGLLISHTNVQDDLGPSQVFPTSEMRHKLVLDWQIYNAFFKSVPKQLLTVVQVLAAERSAVSVCVLKRCRSLESGRSGEKKIKLKMNTVDFINPYKSVKPRRFYPSVVLQDRVAK